MTTGRDFEAELEAAGRAMEAKCKATDNGLEDRLADKPNEEWQKAGAALDQPTNAWVRPFQWRDPSTIPCREWLYGRHYVRRFISATFAPGGVGKSSLVLTEALAMASGKPLLGTVPKRRLKIACWNGEDPFEETERRAAAAASHYGLGAADLEGWLFLGSGRDVPLVLAEQQASGTVILAPNVERVLEAVRDFGLDVIIIDPFVSSHRASENDNNAIDIVVKEWARIADRANISIELVHHTRKANGSETTVEDGRGASALLYAARSARVLNVMSKDEAQRAGVERHRSYFRVDSGKSNMTLAPEGSDWFHMISVDLDNGDALNEGDHVGVVTRWSWPDPFDGVSVSDLYAVQKAIDGGRWRENSQAVEWVGKAVAEVLGLDLDDKADKQKVKGLLATWTKNGALVRVTATDDKSRPRPVVAVGKWAVVG